MYRNCLVVFLLLDKGEGEMKMCYCIIIYSRYIIRENMYIAAI